FAALLGGAFLPAAADALRLAAGLAALWFWRSAVRFDASPASLAFGAAAAALALLLPGPLSNGGLVQLAGSVLLLPIVEELALRGFVFRRLVSADFEQLPPGAFTALAVAASALLSGLIQPHFFAGAACGLVYTLAQIRRGRVADAIAAHMIANALVAIPGAMAS
ncbi:MAG TPA: CPBP family glutamic-type intramembrane protease, partial [Myxococcales bacterium]|nr:CPBP family glutamic-type intramembrane protease [Myxococcales bacterium]